MKLGTKNTVSIGFMLFSMFFGAGNLIFPPFLGQMAGENTLMALLGFLVTAVVLPVLGVAVVADFGGLDKLARHVSPKFSLIFTILIYLSIGPGLGIPRAASVPFEMSIAPYLPQGASATLFMILYSLVFFALSAWLSLTPNKLVDRLGKLLTPIMLALIAGLLVSFLMWGKSAVTPPQPAYETAPLITGFLEGYNTMDAIGALNFGLVIATTLHAMNVHEHKSMMRYTYLTGGLAGLLLALVYAVLSYLGMQSSGVYELKGNGAWTLRCVSEQLFGPAGTVLLILLFTLACLTTCVGLTNSIAQYFSSLTPKISYKAWTLIITGFSFVICNQGLNAILSISVPILTAIYPSAILLIVMGLCHKWLRGNPFFYPCTIGATALVSILLALEGLKVPMGFVTTALGHLPFHDLGMGWVSVSVAMLFLSWVAGLIFKKKSV